MSVVAGMFDMLSEIFSLMQSIITHHPQSCPPLLHPDVVSAACQLWHIKPELPTSLEEGAYQLMIEALCGYLRVTIHFQDYCPSTSLHPLSNTLYSTWMQFTGKLVSFIGGIPEFCAMTVFDSSWAIKPFRFSLLCYQCFTLLQDGMFNL
jgi:hypothetical protein